MIESYFDLTRPPFRLGTDTTFYFASETHRKAMSYIRFGMQQGEGFVLITGDTGVGKSMLVEYLREELDPNEILAAQMSVGHVQEGAIIDNILQAFRIEACGEGSTARYDAIEAFLIDQLTFGLQCILIIDESQNLTGSALEEIRILSNLQARGQSLLQVFLIGQNELNELISARNMDQLRQRIVSSYKISALSEEETVTYIDHRMVAAGWGGDMSAFSEDAHALIYRFTAGVPRQINALCSRLLLQAAIDEAEFVDSSIVRIVTDELREERKALDTPEEPGVVDVKTLPPVDAGIKKTAQNEMPSEPSDKGYPTYKKINEAFFPDTVLGNSDDEDTAYELLHAQRLSIESVSKPEKEDPEGEVPEIHYVEKEDIYKDVNESQDFDLKGPDSTIPFFDEFDDGSRRLNEPGILRAKDEISPVKANTLFPDRPDDLSSVPARSPLEEMHAYKLNDAGAGTAQAQEGLGPIFTAPPLFDDPVYIADDGAARTPVFRDVDSGINREESQISQLKRGLEKAPDKPDFDLLADTRPTSSDDITASLLEIKRIMQAPMGSGEDYHLPTDNSGEQAVSLDQPLIDQVEAFSKLAVGGEDLWVRETGEATIYADKTAGEKKARENRTTAIYNRPHEPQSDYIGSTLDRLMARPEKPAAERVERPVQSIPDIIDGGGNMAGDVPDLNTTMRGIAALDDNMTSIETRLESLSNQWQDRSAIIERRLGEIDGIIEKFLDNLG